MICLMYIPGSVDTSNLSSVASIPCPVLSVNDLKNLQQTFNNAWLSPPPPFFFFSFFASSFTLISYSTSLWLPALLFTSTGSQTSKSSASWSAEAAVKRMHCDTYSSQGLGPWTRACSICRPPFLSTDAGTRGAPKLLTASWAWWHPRGSTWHMTEKRKTKINHTSKDGVYQLGEKEKWPKPWHILGMYWFKGSAGHLANWLLICIIFICWRWRNSLAGGSSFSLSLSLKQ